jgi:hypothetical protein
MSTHQFRFETTAEEAAAALSSQIKDKTGKFHYFTQLTFPVS